MPVSSVLFHCLWSTVTVFSLISPFSIHHLLISMKSCPCGVRAEVNSEMCSREIEAEWGNIHYLYQQPLVLEIRKWSLLYDVPNLLLGQQKAQLCLWRLLSTEYQSQSRFRRNSSYVTSCQNYLALSINSPQSEHVKSVDQDHVLKAIREREREQKILSYYE